MERRIIPNDKYLATYIHGKTVIKDFGSEELEDFIQEVSDMFRFEYLNFKEGASEKDTLLYKKYFKDMIEAKMQFVMEYYKKEFMNVLETAL